MEKTPAQYQTEHYLGQLLQAARKAQGLTPKQLGHAVNVTLQQITRYEEGAFIPLPLIENLTGALGQRAPKKLIRRISFLRKLEAEKKQDHAQELCDLYDEVFENLINTHVYLD